MLSGSPLSTTPFSAISSSLLLSASVGSFALTGNDARFDPIIVQVEAGSFALTGQDVAFPLTTQFALERGSFLLTGNDTAAVRNGVSGSGTFTLTGQDAGLVKGPILAGEFGEFILTGNQAALSADIRVPQLGQHSVNTLVSPTNFATGQLDANTVRSNDNIVAQAVTAHDADDAIHVQSGALSRRPVSSSEGATWIATDTQDTYCYISGAWVQVAWAHWYGGFSDYTDQTQAAINTAQAITFNTTDVSRGVSVVSSSRLTVSYAGVYNFMWSGQFVNTDSQIQDVDVWIRINGTDVAGSTGRISVPNKHGSIDGHVLPAWNYFLTLNANDYVELYWAVTSTAVSLQTNAASAWAPSTASVIATLNRV